MLQAGRTTRDSAEALQEAAWQYDQGAINEEEFLTAAICRLGEMADDARGHAPADPQAAFYGCAEKMPEVGAIATALMGITRHDTTRGDKPPRPWQRQPAAQPAAR